MCDASKNMGYLFLCLCLSFVCILFNFFLSKSCSFQWTDLSLSWLNLFLRIFYSILNRIFVIYFSDILLLVYRNTNNFSTLISYPGTLLKSLMNSNSVLVECLGFSKIISSAKKTILLPLQFVCL